MYDSLKTSWLMSLRLVLVLVTIISTFILASLASNTIKNDWLYFGTILIIFTVSGILIHLIYYFCAFLDKRMSKNLFQNVNKLEDNDYMKVYDRICLNEIDDIIKESNGKDIKYIRDGDRSADDLDVIYGFINKGYSCEIKTEKGYYSSVMIVINFKKNV